MFVGDRIILPLGCILCGLLTAAGGAVRMFPRLGPLIRGLVSWRATAGTLTAVAGLLSLAFPPDGPSLFGSLFPAVFGILVGAFQILEYLLEFPALRRRKKALSWIGNALLYARTPVGFTAVGLGILHLCIPGTLFF